MEDEGKYISQAAPAAVLLQYARDELFLTGEVAEQYLKVVSEPKRLKIYDAPHALNAEATRGSLELTIMAGRRLHGALPTYLARVRHIP